MSTGTAIIQDALAEIGAASVASPPSPQAIETGRKKLNSMLELWLSRNIRIGTTPLEVAADELNEPDDARNAIVLKLALLLAPSFSNGKQIVTPDLRANARDAFAQVKSLYGALTIPDKVVSSTLPLGQGNKTGYGRRRTYFPEGGTVDN